MLNNQDFAQLRQKSLGGSDIAPLLGLSTFKSPLDIWLEKTRGQIPIIDSLAIRFGSYAEAFIADEYERRTGYTTELHPQIYHPDYPFLTGHIDRLVIVKDQESGQVTRKILECKTANPYRLQDWGKLETDEVPAAYLVQCQWYMALTGIKKTDLAVFIGNSDLRLYEINYDMELGQTLINKAKYFWERYVTQKIPPPPLNENDCRELFIQSSNSKVKEANPVIIDKCRQLFEIQDQIKLCEERFSQLKYDVMVYMEDSELLKFEDKTLITWKSNKPSKKLDLDQLKIDHAELLSNYYQMVAGSRRFLMKDKP